MKINKRNIIQLGFTLFTIIICVWYYLYIVGETDVRILSIGDLNPYGGWSALKAAVTDPGYRFRGITKSIALTIGILVLALLMGRFFCGFICPIGALQDFFKHMGTKMRIKEVKLPRWKFFNPEMLKYLILLIALVLSILGLGNKVSPYSPWLAYLNVFLGFNFQSGFIVLLVIILASLFIKRIFCRCFCPLGAFQSLLAAIGPSSIKSNEVCNGCSNCLRNCIVDIERPNKMEVSPECVRCIKCVESKCIKDSEGYTIDFGKTKIGKSQYIAISLIFIIGIYLFLPLIQVKASNQPIVELGTLKDGTYIGTSYGFGGIIQVEVIIEDNKIVEINPMLHNETKGYYEEVFRRVSLDIIKSQTLNVDVISGATVTSRGFLNGIKSGVSQALGEK